MPLQPRPGLSSVREGDPLVEQGGRMTVTILNGTAEQHPAAHRGVRSVSKMGTRIPSVLVLSSLSPASLFEGLIDHDPSQSQVVVQGFAAAIHQLPHDLGVLRPVQEADPESVAESERAEVLGGEP